MSVFSRMIVGLAVSALLLAGSTASAAKYLVSFSGTMASGNDSGLFGAPGDLTGKSFVATYAIDTKNTEETDPGVYQYISPAPVVLTIAGSTHIFPTTHLLWSFASAEVGKLDFRVDSAVDADPLAIEAIKNTAFSPWFQPKLDFGGSAIISAPGSGDFYIHVCCCPSCGPNFEEIQSSGSFNTDRVTVLMVPEPTTWALMITGFGLAGAALRRRRGSAA